MKASADRELADSQHVKTNECLVVQREAQKAWDAEHKVYNGWKYAAITGFNLIILLIAVMITFQEAVVMGLFFGTVATAFIATVSYWDYARTKLGFVLMLVVFFVVLFFVNKRQKSLSLHDRKK